MSYIVAVFRNKTETYAFSNALGKVRIGNDIISTPSTLGEVCGVSVRFLKRDFKKALQCFKRFNFLSFNYFYAVEYDYYGNAVFKRININLYG